MVQLAKQATSQFSTVNIQVGGVMKMPYDDNVFDVALSVFVITVLQLEAYISHFKEMQSSCPRWESSDGHYHKICV